MLKSLWVSCLSQPLNGIGMPKEVMVHSFGYPRSLSSTLNYLPCSFAVDFKNLIIQAKLLGAGIAL